MMKGIVMQWLREAGVYRAGVAALEPVSPAMDKAYARWIEAGRHGGMSYMERYADVRRDPRLLLDGAVSLISCAFPYYYPLDSEPVMARYALGDDYHDVVRRRLEDVAEKMRAQWRCATRVCVDTAPLRERYWAVRAGVGFVGRNNQLIVPGGGSYFFLGEILTTLEIAPDESCRLACGDCGACVTACPAGALDGVDNALDARRCLSCLTIEHRGDFPPGTRLHGHLYGCDECQRVCPHNAHPAISSIPEFRPRPAVAGMTLERAAGLSQAEFSAIFVRSAVKRTKLAGLQRNAKAILDDKNRTVK